MPFRYPWSIWCMLLLALAASTPLPCRCFAQQCGGEEPVPDLPASHGSPIVIAIHGSRYRFTDNAHGVQFDINADGKLEEVSWTDQNADVGFLVLDRNGNGVIDNGQELFGNYTSQPQVPNPNGFAALAVFDSPEYGGNHDGVIDQRDKVFAFLRLWIDRNHDGISQPDELLTLPEAGVKSISVAYETAMREDQDGNQFRYRSRIEAELGASVARWAYDVFLVVSPLSTLTNSPSQQLVPPSLARVHATKISMQPFPIDDPSALVAPGADRVARSREVTVHARDRVSSRPFRVEIHSPIDSARIEPLQTDR